MASPRPVLELLEFGSSLLAVATALPNDPPRSLRTSATDELALRFTSGLPNNLPSSPPSVEASSRQAVLQVVVATVPDSLPPLLSSVAVVWLPTSPRSELDVVDTLRLAVVLWRPDRPSSPLYSFTSAYAAVSRMSRTRPGSQFWTESPQLG